jgi:hypothetical protein
MSLQKLFPTRTCPECQEPFTAVPRRDGTFPEACKAHIRAFHGKQRRGIVPIAFRTAIAAKKQRARARAEAALRQQFGPISDRDAAVFAFAVSVGYQRGHSLGYNAGRRKGVT